MIDSSCMGLEGNGRRLFVVSSAIFLEVHNKPRITQMSIIICFGMRITDERDSLISSDRKQSLVRSDILLYSETSNISIHFSSKYYELVAIFIHLERTF